MPTIGHYRHATLWHVEGLVDVISESFRPLVTPKKVKRARHLVSNMHRGPTRGGYESGYDADSRPRAGGRGGKGKAPGRSKPGEGRRRRNDRGQYVETVTDEDILALLEQLPGPVITTTDVAETFDMTTEGARRKLNDLCEAGVLDRRKSGQTRVYWQIDSERSGRN